jgi:hypothetical protein
MAKQKFYCQGVERASGRRVAVTLSADSKEAAVRIAKEHGVLVESVAPAGEQAPQPAAKRASAAERVVEGADEDVSGLLDSPDDEADGLDLDEEAAAKPTSLVAPATKSCPYCGERVLAVAIRCKHCGSYLAPEQPVVRQPVEPVEDLAPRAALPPRAWVGIAVVAGVIVIAAVVWQVFFNSPAPPAPAVPVATPVQPLPTPMQPAPPPEKPKPSPEEKAYAVKLAAFLDEWDATAKLLKTAPKADVCAKQCERLKTRYAAIPPPPKSAAWAAEAATASAQLLLLADALPLELVTQEAAAPFSGNDSGMKDACRRAATQIKGVVAPVRALIPPACLTP